MAQDVVETSYEAARQLVEEYLVEELSGDAAKKRAEELERDTHELMQKLRLDAERRKMADTIVDALVPNNIDVRLWADLAEGRNVDLPVSDQYGPVATRLRQPDAPAGRGKGHAGNIYGRVHSKGDQAPSAFLKRQSEFRASITQKIARHERELATLRHERDAIEHGERVYAATALLTAMRKATAPIFALGPAWTLMRAIAGPTDVEAELRDQVIETKLIMVVLHALRGNEAFQHELKIALLQVCSRFEDEAARAQVDTLDFGSAYEEVLDQLRWPPDLYR